MPGYNWAHEYRSPARPHRSARLPPGRDPPALGARGLPNRSACRRPAAAPPGRDPPRLRARGLPVRPSDRRPPGPCPCSRRRRGRQRRPPRSRARPRGHRRSQVPPRLHPLRLHRPRRGPGRGGAAGAGGHLRQPQPLHPQGGRRGRHLEPDLQPPVREGPGRAAVGVRAPGRVDAAGPRPQLGHLLPAARGPLARRRAGHRPRHRVLLLHPRAPRHPLLPHLLRRRGHGHRRGRAHRHLRAGRHRQPRAAPSSSANSAPCQSTTGRRGTSRRRPWSRPWAAVPTASSRSTRAARSPTRGSKGTGTRACRRAGGSTTSTASPTTTTGTTRSRRRR